MKKIVMVWSSRSGSGPETWKRNLLASFPQEMASCTIKEIGTLYDLVRYFWLLWTPQIYLITYTQDIVTICIVVLNTWLQHTHIHVVHGDFYAEEQAKRWVKKLLWLRVNEWLCARSVKVVVSSQWLKDRIGAVWRVSPEKITVIPNAYQFTDRIILRQVDKYMPIRCLTITWFTHLEKCTGVLDLIKAFSTLPFPIQFTIVGWWPLQEQIKAAVPPLDNAQLTVEFIWSVLPTQIASYFQNHDMFVYCSYLDNGPLALLEAIDAGMPVLANDIWFVPQLLASLDNRWWGMYTSWEVFGEKFVALAKDESYRIAFAAKQKKYATNHFGSKVVCEMWNDFLVHG